MNRAFALGLFLILCIVTFQSVLHADDVDPWQQKISVSLTDVPLQEALGKILDQTQISMEASRSALGRRVTAVFKDVTRDKALREIANAAGVTIKREGNSITVEDKAPQPSDNPDISLMVSNLINCKSVLASYKAAGKGSDDPQVASLEASIAEIEKQLAIERGRQQAQSNTSSVTPNLSQLLAEAEQEIRKAEFELKEGVKELERMEKDGGFSEGVLNDQREYVEKAHKNLQAARDAEIVNDQLSLRFLKPAELIPLCRSQGVLEVIVTSGNTITMVGPLKAVVAARTLIQRMDQPSAIPQTVNVTVTVKVTVTTGNEPPKSIEMSMSSPGTMGEAIHLANRTSGNIKDETLALNMSVIPVPITGEGEIGLSVDGIMEYLLSGKPQGMSTFKTTRKVVPGKPESIGGGSSKQDDTETKYELWVTVSKDSPASSKKGTTKPLESH